MLVQLSRLTQMRQFSASTLWYYSSRAYRRGNLPLAFLLKTINFFVFRAILGYTCEVEKDIDLWHYGFGSVIDGNVTIGKRVSIGHHVTFAPRSLTGVPGAPRITIEDDCVIGAYAFIMGPGITIGSGSKIGATCLVNRDLEPGTNIVALPDRAAPRSKSKMP